VEVEVNIKIPGALAVVTLIGIGCAGPAMAQSHVCKDNTGRRYVSSSPCPQGMVYYAPLPERALQPSYVPSVGEAPVYLKYMSPRCSSLHDAMRTAPARGVSGEAIRDMSREYARDCREEESAAMRQLSEQARDKRQEGEQARKTAANAASNSKAQTEMCYELGRVLRGKRARTNMTDGERADLQRSEEAFQKRCG